MKQLMMANFIITVILLAYFAVESLVGVPVSISKIMSGIYSVVLFLQMILYFALMKKHRKNNDKN